MVQPNTRTRTKATPTQKSTTPREVTLTNQNTLPLTSLSNQKNVLSSKKVSSKKKQRKDCGMEWKDIEKSKNVNVSKGNAGVDIFSLFFPFFSKICCYF